MGKGKYSGFFISIGVFLAGKLNYGNGSLIQLDVLVA
jgi:hypothetical protein